MIDYDYASHLDNVGYSVGFRTVCYFTINLAYIPTHVTQGTGPFMSLEVLHTAGDDQIKQKPSHDIESIYYVLLYICLKFKGPNNTRRTSEDIKLISMPIDQWFDAYPRFRKLGEKKRAQLDDLQTRFIEKFPPYFDIVRQCMLDLWDILFPPSVAGNGAVSRNIRACTATHNQVLAVLRGLYKNLPDVEDIPRRSSKKGKEKDTGVKKRPADDKMASPDSGFFSMAGTGVTETTDSRAKRTRVNDILSQ